MTRVLFIGDQHFKHGNLHIVDIFLLRLEAWLIDNPVDLIVSGGDLLDQHERVHTLCLNKAIQYIDMLCKYATTYILVGNHDAINNQIFLNTEQHWLNCFKKNQRVVIVDTIKHVTLNDVKYVFAPYVPDKRFQEALSTYPNWKSADVIFAHQTFNGAKMGAILSHDIEDWLPSYPMCVSGHIHQSQWIGDNLYYAGSAFQQGFSDSHDKTVACVVTKNKSTTILPYDLNLPQKKTIYLSTDELEIGRAHV